MKLHALRVRGTRNVVCEYRSWHDGVERVTYAPRSAALLGQHALPHWLTGYEATDPDKWPKVVTHWLSTEVVPAETLEVTTYELMHLGGWGDAE